MVVVRVGFVVALRLVYWLEADRTVRVLLWCEIADGELDSVVKEELFLEVFFVVKRHCGDEAALLVR